MTVAQRQSMSLEQFLVWEERQERPFEFDGFQPVAMTGGTFAHDRITFNVQKALDARLTTGPCKPCGPNVKILVAGRVRYPDAVVTCKPVAPNATVVNDPVIVFEVISDDTARTDRIEKLREYQATPSIRRYVILEQKSIGATVFAREENFWSALPLAEGDTLDLPEIDASIPLAEFYAGLEFSKQLED
jgi:Uma2 family endonuclease